MVLLFDTFQTVFDVVYTYDRLVSNFGTSIFRWDLLAPFTYTYSIGNLDALGLSMWGTYTSFVLLLKLIFSKSIAFSTRELCSQHVRRSRSSTDYERSLFFQIP